MLRGRHRKRTAAQRQNAAMAGCGAAAPNASHQDGLHMVPAEARSVELVAHARGRHAIVVGHLGVHHCAPCAASRSAEPELHLLARSREPHRMQRRKECHDAPLCAHHTLADLLHTTAPPAAKNVTQHSDSTRATSLQAVHRASSALGGHWQRYKPGRAQASTASTVSQHSASQL